MYTVLEYMYRDGSNYKQGTEVAFDGEITPEETEQLEKALDEGVYFIARQVGLPSMFFSGVDDDDHPWHEYLGVDVFDAEIPVTTTHDERDVHEFVKQFVEAGRLGWNAREETKLLMLPEYARPIVDAANSLVSCVLDYDDDDEYVSVRREDFELLREVL